MGYYGWQNDYFDPEPELDYLPEPDEPDKCENCGSYGRELDPETAPGEYTCQNPRCGNIWSIYDLT
jgi:hypothetical protein